MAMQYSAILGRWVDVAEDGQVVKRPMTVMDSAQSAYEQRISNAWKEPPPELPEVEHGGGKVTRDNGQASYEQRVRNAWR